jgi:hypothetical protein
LHEYLRSIRLFISDTKWLFNKNLRKQLKKIKTAWEER